jgi:hypothetical protein
MMPAEELARIPAAPPRSPGLLPGLRLSRAFSGRGLLVPGIFLLILSLIPIASLTQDPQAELAFRKTERTAGRVEHVERGQDCSQGSLEISYSFTDPRGIPFRGHGTVCQSSSYAGIRAGDRVAVVYVEANPAVNGLTVEDRLQAGSFAFQMLIPIVALLLFAPLLWPQLSQLRRDRGLFRKGVLAKGSVVYVAATRDGAWPAWAATRRHQVFVTARLPSGEEKQVRACCTNDWLLQQMPPGQQVNVCVQGDRAVLLENYLR